MKKHLALGLLLMAGVAQADNEMAYMNNKLGGQIFFTYSPCVYVATQQRIPDNYYVYSTDTGGNKVADGCYEYKYPFYFVEWNKGGRLSVNIKNVVVIKKDGI